MQLQHSLLFLVACVALHLVPASSSSSSSSPSALTLTQNLIDWIRTREGGIYNPKQEEKTFGESNNARGIFASEDIAEGEILLAVPWHSIIGAKGATQEVMVAEYERKTASDENIMVTQCRVVRDLYHEVQKGEASDFAPHLRYLSLLDIGDDENNNTVVPVIPSMWSEEGRDLLEDINDHGVLPPNGLFTTLNHDWYGACIKDIQNNPLEANVAAVVAAHGSSGFVLSEFGILVPLFDNYHYNQRQQILKASLSEDHDNDNTNANTNAKGIVDYGESFRLVATRPIQKGEQIYRPFGNFFHTEFTTPDIFRNYGITDEIYPKFYEFAFAVNNEEGTFLFGIEVNKDDDDDEDDENDDGGGGFDIGIHFTYEEDVQELENILQFLEKELNRLQRLEAVASRSGKSGTMKQREWDTAWQYHRNLVTVMELTLQELRRDDSDSEDEDEETDYACPGGFTPTRTGTCPIWDGFDDLPSSVPISDLILAFNDENPYGPTEAA
jgi:hypothetical protein